MPVECDFIVIGAGMAGAAVAAQLATRGRVHLLEMESQPGYHTTGRSAALFSEIYGNRAIRSLTRASKSFLFDPPDGFAQAPLVRPRMTLFFANAEQMPALERFRADADIRASTEVLSAAAAHELIPAFAPGYLSGAVLEPGSADIDVNALHQGFLRQVRHHGGTVHTSAEVTDLSRTNGRWTASTRGEQVVAPVVVNAAGAWADRVGQLAGVPPVGVQPLRRTALLIDVPHGLTADRWPAAIDIDEQFYFKPDAGLLLLSPADEHPSEPCDAQPEEFDVAEAVDRFERATGSAVRKVRHRWAGLRVFAPDRSPVIGREDAAPGFFWFAGLGGYGIQTAYAAGRVGAALACGEDVPADIAVHGLDATDFAPGRLRHRAA